MLEPVKLRLVGGANGGVGGNVTGTPITLNVAELLQAL